MLPTAVWFVTGVAAAAPGLLLFPFTESRLPQVAGTALVVAGVVAGVSGVACAMGASGPALLGASVAVALLSLAAAIVLELDGQVSPAGWVVFGGAVGLLAVFAGALTLRARRRGAAS